MAGMDLAYWLSPSGKVMEPAMYHIGAIVGNPDVFGETEETINATFDKHGEPVSRNSEGKARNEIMKRVMERGFIRIRKQNLKRSQSWVIELYKLTNRKVKDISNWAKYMIDKKLTNDVFADVMITDLKGFQKITNNLAMISKGIMEDKKMTGRSINGLVSITIPLNVLADPVELTDVSFCKESELSESWPNYLSPSEFNRLIEKIDLYSTDPSTGPASGMGVWAMHRIAKRNDIEIP